MHKHCLIISILLLSLAVAETDIWSTSRPGLTQQTSVENPLPAGVTPSWTLISDHTVATVYNAVKEQCNSNPAVTASRYRINTDDVLSDRIVAMERTMMNECGIHYGDCILIEGAGRWDGIWQVQDTMNKRFAGLHKIDILVPNDIRLGKWKDVKVYVPADAATNEYARKQINS